MDLHNLQRSGGRTHAEGKTGIFTSFQFRYLILLEMVKPMSTRLGKRGKNEIRNFFEAESLQNRNYLLTERHACMNSRQKKDIC